MAKKINKTKIQKKISQKARKSKQKINKSKWAIYQYTWNKKWHINEIVIAQQKTHPTQL